MNIQSFPPELSGILGVLDIIDTPGFVLTVDDGNVIRFAGLNRALETCTGLHGAEVAGLTPHEALPPRVADTVLMNYLRCVETGKTYRYEEVLDLPSGRIWWQTTLSPVFRDGRTVLVVGLATDVTALRAEIAEAAADIGDLRAQSSCLQTFGRAVMAETRGPLNNILALGRLLRAEFRPPTTKKDEVLDLMLETAQGALANIDGFEKESETTPVQSMRTVSRVELDHICRDIAALIDPARTLSISFPAAVVLADAGALQTALQSLMEIVAHQALTFIRLSTCPDPRKPRLVRFSIAFDTHDCSQSEDPAWLRASVEARGGTLRVLCDRSDGGECTDTFELTFPGKLLPHGGHCNTASSQSAPAGSRQRLTIG